MGRPKIYNTPRRHIGVVVRTELKDAITWLAQQENRSVSNLVETMIDAYLEVRKIELRRDGIVMPDFVKGRR